MLQTTPRRKSGRPKTTPQAMTVRLPAGTVERITALLNGALLGEWLRTAVLQRLERDEPR